MAVSCGYLVEKLHDRFSISEQHGVIEDEITRNLSEVVERCALEKITVGFSISFGDPVLLTPRADGGETALMHDVTIYISLLSTVDECFSQEKAERVWARVK